jgi:type IV secretory pathway VirJ component
MATAILVIGGSVIRPRSTGHVATAPVWTPVSQQRLSHGRFENFTVYVPHATPRAFVLLLSDIGGWNQSMNELAEHLAARGAMVAGLDAAQLNAALEADPAQCVFPDGDLENLSHFIQAYFRLPTYLSPILAGHAAGGTLAYAVQVQAPQNTFAGAVSMQFCPSYPLSKPLCKGSGIEFTPAQGKGVEFLPSKQPGNAWTVLQSESGGHCDLASTQKFVGRVPGAQLVTLPAAGPVANAKDAAPPAVWTPPIEAAFDEILARNSATPAATLPAALGDLPIVTVAAQPGSASTDTFAILLSGDGGWAGLDKEVAGALAANGIPVIGLDSLRYFWGARTPAGLAADIDRMTRYYLTALGMQRVMLIGYSQGADVLPFAVNRLSAATRSHVSLVAVIGLSEHALFEFHVSSWLSDDESGPATLPEVDRITGVPVLCIYGEGETDSLCPKLDSRKASVVKLKGGHHFDGDYAGLARAILAAAHR